MVKVAILVNNIITQKNLASTLSSYKDVQVLSTNMGLFKTLRENPDIIILEVLSSADETHTLNLLNQIRSSTNSKIIVTSDRRSKFLFRLTSCVVNAMPTKWAALGIVIYEQSWDISIQNIIQAVDNVSRNRNWIDPVIAGIVIKSKIINAISYENIDDNGQERPRVKCCQYRLTDKERQILYLIASGKKNQEIASNLNVKLPTIKTHINNIQKKMKTNTRIYTVIQGLLDGVIKIEEIKSDSNKYKNSDADNELCGFSS